MLGLRIAFFGDVRWPTSHEEKKTWAVDLQLRNHHNHQTGLQGTVSRRLHRRLHRQNRPANHSEDRLDGKNYGQQVNNHGCAGEPKRPFKKRRLVAVFLLIVGNAV